MLQHTICFILFTRPWRVFRRWQPHQNVGRPGRWPCAPRTNHTPNCHLSVFFATLIHVSLFFVSFPFVSSVSSGLRNSLISSSHLFFGLSTGLFVWCLGPRTGFHFAVVFVHRLSGNDAILIANRHFILLCVSIQHGILVPLIIFSLCVSVSSSCTSFSFVQLSRSILRWVVRIILSCSFVRVHVPEA